MSPLPDLDNTESIQCREGLRTAAVCVMKASVKCHHFRIFTTLRAAVRNLNTEDTQTATYYKLSSCRSAGNVKRRGLTLRSQEEERS
jgi:hypothetical protein